MIVNCNCRHVFGALIPKANSLSRYLEMFFFDSLINRMIESPGYNIRQCKASSPMHFLYLGKVPVAPVEESFVIIWVLCTLQIRCKYGKKR